MKHSIGALLISSDSHLIYYNETGAFRSNVILDQTHGQLQIQPSQNNDTKLMNLILNHSNNNHTNNDYDSINLTLSNSTNRIDWHLCYCIRSNITIGMVLMKHKLTCAVITFFLDSIYCHIKQCFQEYQRIPMYILSLQCHLSFHQLLKQNPYHCCNPHQQRNMYKTIPINCDDHGFIEIEMEDIPPPSYSLSTLKPAVAYRDYQVEDAMDSGEEEEKELLSSSSQYWSSDSDVIACATELKFVKRTHAASDEGVLGLITIREHRKRKQKELKKAYHTTCQTFTNHELQNEYNTSLQNGLPTNMANELWIKLGPNQLTPPKHESWCKILCRLVCGGCFNIINWIGTIFCVVVYLVGHNPYYLYLALVFFIFIVICVCAPCWCMPQGLDWTPQPQYVTVIRDGTLQKVNAEELVNGDVVELTGGMKVPADIRIFECSPDLMVDNSPLTGESEPQLRNCTPCNETPYDSPNLCFFGTYILCGRGKGIVIATGDQCFMGRTAQLSSSTGARSGSIYGSDVLSFTSPQLKRVVSFDDDKMESKGKLNEWIDNVYGDLENMFYLLSDLSYYCMIVDYCVFIKIMACVVVYSFIIAVTLLMVITSCLFVLIFRFDKIEMNSVQVEIRQKVIEYESCLKRFGRLITQCLRCTLMTFCLFIYPLMLVYLIIPKYDDGAICIASYLMMILVLQILGTYRGLKAHTKRQRMASPFKPKSFTLNIGSCFAITMIVLEIAQLTLISHDTVNITKHKSESLLTVQSASLIQINTILKNALATLSFRSWTVSLDYSMFTCALLVALLLCVFVTRFIYELRHYAYLKYIALDTTAAREFYFHSFIGCIIYGHGTLKNVNPWVVKMVSILSDVLFLFICSSLISILVYSQSQHYAAISLVLLSFYVPLSTMIAPLFEATDDIKTEPSFLSLSNSIRTVKSYLCVVTVSKCFMLFVSSFVFTRNPLAIVCCNIFVCLLLIVFTIKWSFQDLYKYGMTQNEPIFPFRVCILRAFGFCCAIIGSIVNLLKLTNIIDDTCDFVVLVSFIAISMSVLLVWMKNIYTTFNIDLTVLERRSTFARFHAEYPMTMNVRVD